MGGEKYRNANPKADYDSKSNFNKFKNNRFNAKPDPKTYEKYEPHEKSPFNKLNRGYSRKTLYENVWNIFFKGDNPFKIDDY